MPKVGQSASGPGKDGWWHRGLLVELLRKLGHLRTNVNPDDEQLFLLVKGYENRSHLSPPNPNIDNDIPF